MLQCCNDPESVNGTVQFHCAPYSRAVGRGKANMRAIEALNQSMRGGDCEALPGTQQGRLTLPRTIDVELPLMLNEETVIGYGFLNACTVAVRSFHSVGASAGSTKAR